MREEAPREPALAAGKARGAGAPPGGELTAIRGSEYCLMRADAGWTWGWDASRHTHRRGGESNIDIRFLIPLGEFKREYLYTTRTDTTGRSELKGKDERTDKYILPATGRAAS